MKLMAIARPRPGIDAPREIAKHASEELQHLWGMYADGVVREMYSPGGPGVVLVLEVVSADAARAALSELPLVANEIVELEVLELRPFVAFQMLVSDGARS